MYSISGETSKRRFPLQHTCYMSWNITIWHVSCTTRLPARGLPFLLLTTSSRHHGPKTNTSPASLQGKKENGNQNLFLVPEVTDVIRWVTCDAGPPHRYPTPTAGLIKRLLPLMAACLHPLWCCRLLHLQCIYILDVYLQTLKLRATAQDISIPRSSVIQATNNRTSSIVANSCTKYTGVAKTCDEEMLVWK